MYQYILLRTLQKKKGDGERSNSGLLDEPTMEAASVTVRSSQDSTIAATANESVEGAVVLVQIISIISTHFVCGINVY